MEWSACNILKCPVDGIWFMWGEWTPCSVTCGMGTQHRNRMCDGPYYGGHACPGSDQDTEFCDSDVKCPDKKKKESPIPEETFTESDNRPSAIGVGLVSLAFVLVELLMVLCFDSITIIQNCRRRLHHRHQHHNHSDLHKKDDAIPIVDTIRDEVNRKNSQGSSLRGSVDGQAALAEYRALHGVHVRHSVGNMSLRSMMGNNLVRRPSVVS